MATTNTSTVCCLCRSDSSNKHKKFHGSSCKLAREVIEGVIKDEYRMTIWSFEETSIDDAVLCQVCERKVLPYYEMKGKYVVLNMK